MEKPAESSLKNLKKLEIREFLNLKGQQGLGAIQIQGFAHGQETELMFVELGVTISDCKKAIDLDFDFGHYSTREEIKNLQYKIKTLISAFDKMNCWLEKAIEQVANASVAKDS